MATTKATNQEINHQQFRQAAWTVRNENSYYAHYPDCYDISLKIYDTLINNFTQLTVENLRIKLYSIPTGKNGKHTAHFAVEVNHATLPEVAVIDASIDQFTSEYGHYNIEIGTLREIGKITVCNLSNYEFRECRGTVIKETGVEHPYLHERYDLTVQFKSVPKTIPLDHRTRLQTTDSNIVDSDRGEYPALQVITDQKTPNSQYTQITAVHEDTGTGPIYILQSFRFPDKIYCVIETPEHPTEEWKRVEINSVTLDQYSTPIKWVNKA